MVKQGNIQLELEPFHGYAYSMFQKPHEMPLNMIKLLMVDALFTK